jgi:hypothetical protein
VAGVSRISYGLFSVFLLDTPHPLSVVGAMKNEVWGTIYSAANIRIGKVSLTLSAYLEMQERKLNLDQLEETFRYGREEEPGKIKLNFGAFTVGMYYAKDETRITRGNLDLERYIILACWKEGVR